MLTVVIDRCLPCISLCVLFFLRYHTLEINGPLVQVRDEIEHLLDDNEDMAQLYLTRKWLQNQQLDAHLGATASNNLLNTSHSVRRINSTRSGSIVTSSDDNDVEDLEMMLEAYFMQLDGTRNKILSVSVHMTRSLLIHVHVNL